MKWMLDTDTCIAIINGKPASVLKKLRGKSVGQVGFSSITLAELAFGAAKSSRRDEAHAALAEFLLALTVALNGEAGFHAIACDTDGIDGTEDNAGALSGPDSLARAAAKRLDAKAMLANNDGYSFFAGIGDLVVTGPTLTNVNDFRAILVDPAA